MAWRSRADGAAVTSPDSGGASASWLGTAMASLTVGCIATAAVWSLTLGLRGWTSEALRRLRVAERPPLLSPLTLVAAAGGVREPWGPSARPPRVQLVTFMYTHCPTVCATVGGTFTQLQREIASDPGASGIGLLSLSFDLPHDDDRALRDYASRHRADAAHWRVAAPTGAPALARLLRETGVVVIPDGFGGYVHNAAIHVVRSDGRLLRIFGVDQPEEALAWARSLRQ